MIEASKRQPEPVVREVLDFSKFLERRRAEKAWADVLPSREVEQEKLDLLDSKGTRATAKSGSWTWAWTPKDGRGKAAVKAPQSKRAARFADVQQLRSV